VAIADVLNRPRLNKALKFSVIRVPFLLEPEYPLDAHFEETNRQRLIRKWGGEKQFEEQKQRHRLKERGLEVGIQHFDLDRIASSTFMSHRLVQWATRAHGITKAEQLYSVLNRRHFEEGQKLNDKSMLAEAAAEVDIPAAEADAFLSSSEGNTEIRNALALLRQMGVNSIPTFVVQGRHVVSGAAHHSQLAVLFREIEQRGEVGEPVFARVLGIPNERIEEGLQDLPGPVEQGASCPSAP